MKVKMPGQFISGKESKQELNEHTKIKVNFVLAMQQIDGTEAFRKDWFGHSLDSKPLNVRDFPLLLTSLKKKNVWKNMAKPKDESPSVAL